MKEDKNLHNNKILDSLRLGITEIFNKKWKIIFLVAYAVAVGYFIKKYIIYDHTFLKNIPDMFYPIVKAIIDIFIENSSFSVESFDLIIKNIFYGFVWLIALLGLLQVIIFIGMIHGATTTQSKVLNVDFPNGLTPKYRGEKKDKKRRHGRILEFECEGLIKDDYVEKTARIESALRKYKIYRVLPDKLDNAIMNLYCMPNKYAKPMLITKDTDFEKIFNLNMLLTGSTGSREVYKSAYSNELLFKNS